MTKRSYEQLACPIARSLSVLGDQWTLMIVRDALMGVRRFEGFQKSLCLSRNLLTRRLRHLVEEGLLTKEKIHGSRRFEYCPTQKCKDLLGVLVTFSEWGEQWCPDPEGPLVDIRHTVSGKAVGMRPLLLENGTEISPAEVELAQLREKDS
ncbi:MAG: putative HTH-type transcriptional regulator [Deltaproteobacteria bacterium]|jgi:DNA-binding HxlR family transcriptional regulator|nr:putative HTH-type transcriptional regulator [Deltaproteobacteria bacterium]